MPKKTNGFLFIDLLFSFLASLIILLNVLTYFSLLHFHSATTLHDQILFNKLLSISSYFVKVNVFTEGKFYPYAKRYPNYIVDDDFYELEKELEEKMKIKNFHIGFTPEGKSCIYRIVVYGEEKEIRKLYFCGE